MSASMAAAKLRRQRGIDEPVEMAVLLGTGLGPLAGALEGPITLKTAVGVGWSADCLARPAVVGQLGARRGGERN